MKPPPPIVALSPGDLTEADVDPFLERVSAAVEGGLRGILLRERALPDGAWLEAFAGLRARTCGVDGMWLGAHDRVHLAVAGEADGIHLGFRSLPPERVRELVGSDLAVGLSTHADDDVEEWRHADYLFHGPVRSTPSKEGWKEPVGFDGLARAVSAAERPVLAIGGMRARDVRPALDAGAHGVAVLSGILGAPDPRAATERYLGALHGGEDGG